jgi:pilus assembly protein CpaE
MSGAVSMLETAPPLLHPAFLAVAADEATAQQLRAAARDRGWPSTAVLRGGPADVESLPLGPGRPALLVLDLDAEEAPVAALSRLAGRLGAGTRILALGTANDVTLYRALIQAGAADYMVKPVTADALRQAFAQGAPTSSTPRHAAPAQGKVCAVVGVRGGVGASTIATNAAWLMAHELRLNTALLDLDLQFGTSALSLDLEPGRGLREALAAPERLDTLLLASSMVQESERLSVLGAEEPLEDSVFFDQQALATLMRELRAQFDCIVVDMPRALVPVHRRLLAGAESVTLVSDLSLAGIRDTVRLSQAVQGAAGTVRVLPVAARVGKERKPQVDRATFERGIQGQLAALVPEDARHVTAAANQGKSLGLVAKGAPVTAALRGLAQRMAGTAPAPKPRSFAAFLAQHLPGLAKGRRA